MVRVFGGRGLDRFRDARSKPAPAGEPIADLGRNITASYNFEQARDYGFCQKDARDDIKQVLDSYQLPRSALSEMPDTPIVWQMTLSRPITASMKEESAAARSSRALGLKANVLIFRLECGDGDSEPGPGPGHGPGPHQ